MSFKSKLLLGFGLLIICCILSAIAIFVLESDRNSERTWVDHTNEVILASNNLLRTLVDAETGQRGFLLTGNEAYLEPYHKAKNEINDNFTDLEKLTADNASQQLLLEKIGKNISLKLAELENTINVAANNREQAIKIVRSNFGQTYMNSLREQISRLIEVEEKLLSERKTKLQSTTDLIRYFLIFEFIALLLISIIIQYYVKTEFVRPVEMLHSGIDKLRLGKDIENISIDEKGEVGQLIKALSKVSKKIKKNEIALYYYATHDELTGLKNRRYLMEHLGNELKRAERNLDFLSLMYLDVNNFKEVNDKNGHAFGDAVLINIAVNMLQQIRGIDMACRIGGDEFCIILPSASLSNANNIANRLSKACKVDIKLRDISLSIGIATCGPDEYADAETLLIMADQLMYESKARSRIEPDSNLSSEVYTKT